ncbi:unnamed protein product, partial [Closterium sp. NIES-54]
MLKVVLNNQSPSLTKDQLLTSLRSEEMRIGVAPRSDGVATFGAGTKVGSSGKGNGDKGRKHGGSGSSSDTNSGRWGQGKGKAGVLDFPWGSKGMAPRGLCHGCWDEGHAWQRCPHRPKGGIPAFLKRGGRGSNGKAQVADEEEQDDKAEAVVGEAVAAVGEEQPREGWWIDSGASHNFTPYASDFKSKLQPPEVRGVRLGDGRVVKAVGMGEVPVVGAGGQLLRIQKCSCSWVLLLIFPIDPCSSPPWSHHPHNIATDGSGEQCTGLGHRGGGSTDCSPCEPCLLGKSARKPFPHEASQALGPLDEVYMDLWGPVRTSSLGGAVYVLSLIDDFTRRVWSFPLPNKESATIAKVLRQWHKDVELECGRKLKAVRSDRGGEFLGDAVKAWKAEFGIKTQLSVADTPQHNGVVERWHMTMAEGIRTLLVDSGLPARLWGEALMWVVWVKNRVIQSALPASITPMEAWYGQKPHVGMARIWGCMGSVMLHGHEKGGKLDARAVMCVCVGVDMESKGWRMLDPSLMRIRIARDVDFLDNVMWKDWDKAKGFGELLQDATAISQLLPLPLSPPSAPADDVEMPLSSLPPAPLSVSVQQQPTPLQQLSGPSVIQRRSTTQATSSSSSSSQHSVPLSTGAPPSPATTSPPPVTGLQVLGIQSGTGGEEVGGDAGVVEGMLCLAREVEGVALAGVSTGDVPRTLAEALRGPEGPAWKAGVEKEVNAMRTMGVWDPEPVDLPPGKKAIGVRYVFRRKIDEDKVVQHKVRLVAKGYTQEPEKDYDQREPEKGPKAWAALKGVHAPAIAAVAVVSERQMAALRIEEDEAVEEGVQKFFDLLTRLEGADLNYSELQKKTKLLALLPESWSSLIINLNRDLPRLSLEDVKRAILHEDFRRRELASADGAGTASIGRGYGRGRGRGRGRNRFGSNNFSRGRGSGGYGNDNKSYGCGRGRFDGECHICHKSGHMWRDCYKLPDGWTPAQGQEGRGVGGGRGRSRGGRGGRGGGAASMKSAGNESESRDDRFPGQFFFVSTQAPAGPENDESFQEPAAVGKVTLHSLDYWVIDSGATYSMTPRADLLTEFEPSP